MSVNPPPSNWQCPNCGSFVPAAQTYCANCGYGATPTKSNTAAQVIWLILFILVGLPSACLGTCFLMFTGQSRSGFEPGWLLLAIAGFAIFGGLLALVIRSFQKRK